MKVLIVTPSYFPIIGGSETLTRNLSIKLNEMGIKTDIMTLNMNKKWNPAWKEEIDKDGLARVFKVPALNLFPGLPNPLFSLFRMNVVPKLDFVRKFRDYDIIHFISEADLSFPLLSYFVSKPKIMHCVGIYRHGGLYWYYMFKRPVLGKIFRRFFRSIADKYAVLSAAGERKLLSDLGVPSNRISVLSHAIDVDVFRPDETKKIDNLVLFVGRIERIKGLHTLLEALSYLEIPVRLAIIGPKLDEKYAEKIGQMSHLVNENGVHSVKLVGAMDQNGLANWYRKAAIVVCPFGYETFSTVVLEALACGTPVISTGTHIAKHSDGILVTSNNPRELAGAIRKLLVDKEMREKYGKEGRRLIEQNFSWESSVQRLASVYREITSHR